MVTKTSFVTILFAALAGSALSAQTAAASGNVIHGEVAQNLSKFAHDDLNLDAATGLPLFGNTFIVQGFIYELGTINESNGVLPDGSPEFPDRVIGTWTCRGWFIGDGLLTATGPFVISHQQFDLGSEPGAVTITTDGLEIVDFNQTVERAITGGTGPHDNVRGVQIQQSIGLNALGGINFRQTLVIEN